ncbi:MAG: helix-turn-helix transcriptional regulator [Campylobacterota bacterium]|nr:helix-turn-helix transcriptional regulator [Campylobacterota bacterium]
MNENKRLREVRKTLGLTAVALAKRIGVKDYKIRDIEGGHQKINIEIVFKLEEVFNVNMRWLLFGKDKMFINSNEGQKTMMEIEPRAIVEEKNRNNIINGVNNGHNGDIHINKKDFQNGQEIEKLISLLEYAPPALIHNITKKLETLKASCEI